jgi:predicted Zn-dependent protease
MKEQILTALKAKFTGVNANILDRIAAQLAKTVTTEDKVATAVEGVTMDLINVIEAYGDSRATDAQKTAVQNYEQKYNLKDGEKVKKPETTTTTTTTTPTTEGGDPTTNQLLQQLLDQNKKLTERLDKMDGERTSASRKAELDEILSKLPENLRKAYSRTPVENLTDEQWGTIKGEITTEVESLAKEVGAKGAVFGRPTNGGGGKTTGGTSDATQEATEAEATAVVDKLNI